MAKIRVNVLYTDLEVEEQEFLQYLVENNLCNMWVNFDQLPEKYQDKSVLWRLIDAQYLCEVGMHRKLPPDDYAAIWLYGIVWDYLKHSQNLFTALEHVEKAIRIFDLKNMTEYTTKQHMLLETIRDQLKEEINGK
jgi:hypothetical protein